MPTRKQLVFSLPAKRDLEEIWQYRAADHSPASADKVLRAIHRAADHLCEFPEMSSAHLNERFGVHILIAGYYLIAYDVTDQEIQIFRVIDGRRGDLAQLFERLS